MIDCIKKLSDAAVDRLLTLALGMVNVESVFITTCPYCGGSNVVRNGKKCGKQRFLCRSCDRTFVTTTHTIMSGSHSPASVWKELIFDTIRGDAIDYTAGRVGLSHGGIFNMRHKFLLALQDMAIQGPVVLEQLSEEAQRPARKHGTEAQKRGISNEYICINTGVSRDGKAVAETVNENANPPAMLGRIE